jgi:hypothetical protein
MYRGRLSRDEAAGAKRKKKTSALIGYYKLAKPATIWPNGQRQK